MSNKRKALRYKQKHLDYQREASATLRMKVLRSVLAVGVGFALTPWLGRDAYAAGIERVDGIPSDLSKTYLQLILLLIFMPSRPMVLWA